MLDFFYFSAYTSVLVQLSWFCFVSFQFVSLISLWTHLTCDKSRLLCAHSISLVVRML